MKRIRRVVAMLLAFTMVVSCNGFQSEAASKKPGRVSVTSVKSSSVGKITVKWKKRSCSGYQIQAARNKSFTSGKVSKKVKGKSKKSKSLTDLKAHKKYYVRVRAYRGKKYGKWSKVKSVTTKGINSNTSMFQEAQRVGGYDNIMNDELITAVNNYRTSKGLSSLSKGNSAQQQAAKTRAYEITKSFSHTRPNGKSSVESYISLSTSKNPYCAENICKGLGNVNAIMNGFKNSSTHNENMLTTKASSVAVSVYFYTSKVNGKLVDSYFCSMMFF